VQVPVLLSPCGRRGDLSVFILLQMDP